MNFYRVNAPYEIGAPPSADLFEIARLFTSNRLLIKMMVTRALDGALRWSLRRTLHSSAIALPFTVHHELDLVARMLIDHQYSQYGHLVEYPSVRPADHEFYSYAAIATQIELSFTSICNEFNQLIANLTQ